MAPDIFQHACRCHVVGVAQVKSKIHTYGIWNFIENIVKHVTYQVGSLVKKRGHAQARTGDLSGVNRAWLPLHYATWEAV